MTTLCANLTNTNTTKHGPATKPVVMHVLHSLDRAGVEVLVHDMIQQFNHEFEFVVVALDEGGELEQPLRELGTHVEIIKRNAGVDFQTIKQITKLIKRYHVNLIHAHQYTPMFYAAMGNWRTRRKAKLIFTEHGRHYPDSRKLKRVIANRVLFNRLIDQITAVGEFVKQALVKNEGFNEKRITVIHNGIDPAHYDKQNPKMRQQVRVELDIDNSRFVIMQTGGMRPVKDHRTAIDAIAQLVSIKCNPLLLLVGDGPVRSDIEAYANMRGVGKNVKLTGRRNDVATLLHCADIALNTSLSEGISVALLEAMAVGLPVVATDVGGNGEIIQHNKTGYLVPRGDDQSISESIKYLIDNPHQCKSFGQMGHMRVCDLFHQNTMHQSYLEMYQNLSCTGREACLS